MTDLVKRLKHFQFDRPSEWLMKEFIEQAERQEKRIEELEEARDNACNDRDMWHSKYEEMLDGVQRIYNNSVQYQEYEGCPGYFDATVYLKVKREELRALLEDDDAE